MRVLWILLMLSGVIVFGAIAGVFLFAILSRSVLGLLSLSGAIGLLSLMAAGACAAGIVMKPREFKDAMKPLEPEVKQAAWLTQLGNQPNKDA